MVYQGLLDPRYILDEAEPYELGILLRGLYLREKDSWEQTRLLAYTAAQTSSAKRLKMSDIMAFPWDDKKSEKDTGVSKEEAGKMREKAKLMEELLNKK